MRKFSGFFVLVVIACLFSVTCCNYELPGNELYPFQSFSTTDEQIRYILADYSLSDDCTAPYGPGLYKRFPVVEQAMLLWDQGVRVVNIDRFSRLNQPHTIKIGSIPVVITGLVFDGVTLDLLDAKNVILTTDAQASEETPIPTEASGNSAIPTEGSTFDFCNNPYWPIKEGAVWVYAYKEIYGQTINKELDYTNSISNLSSDSQGASFDLTVHYDPINTGSTVTYTCNPQGEVFDYSSRLVLVPENILLGQSSYQRFFSIKNESISVPAGQFDVITLYTNRDNGGMECFSYARGIGLVYWNLTGGGYTTEIALKSYSLP
jgi:hypothetical protein